MKSSKNSHECIVEEIIHLIGRRSENLFATRQLWCSGAVLVAMNRGLGGDLTQDQAIRLTAGMGDGLSGSGCVCGGLNGAALAIGLFLGNGRFTSRGDQKVLKATRRLHDQFKQADGSACCRVLLKKDSDCRKSQYQSCAKRTVKAAELSTALILEQRPELVQHVEWNYLKHQNSVIEAHLKIAASIFKK